MNEQWNFDENGNCGGSPDMYVTNQNSSSSGSVPDKMLKKKTEGKFTPQEYYEKRKYLREQFEEEQAEKERIREQVEDKSEQKEIFGKLQEKRVLLSEQNASRVIKRYKTSILKY